MSESTVCGLEMLFLNDLPAEPLRRTFENGAYLAQCMSRLFDLEILDCVHGFPCRSGPSNFHWQNCCCSNQQHWTLAKESKKTSVNERTGTCKMARRKKESSNANRIFLMVERDRAIWSWRFYIFFCREQFARCQTISLIGL